jgi:hypothetical protein
MPNAVLVGKEETFRSLGLKENQKVQLESLISRLKEMFEKDYYDCEDVGQAVLEGLKDVRDGRVDNRPWRQVLDEI